MGSRLNTERYTPERCCCNLRFVCPLFPGIVLEAGMPTREGTTMKTLFSILTVAALSITQGCYTQMYVTEYHEEVVVQPQPPPPHPYPHPRPPRPCPVPPAPIYNPVLPMIPVQPAATTYRESGPRRSGSTATQGTPSTDHNRGNSPARGEAR